MGTVPRQLEVTALKILTHRFGEIDIPEETLFHFPEGLIGLSRFHRFVLLEDPQSKDLIWLQSVDDPRFALATIRSEKLGGEYVVEIQSQDCETLELADISEAEILIVLNRVDGNFFANLKGPVILNVAAMRGKQVVLSDPGYSVRHPIHAVDSPQYAAPAVAPWVESRGRLLRTTFRLLA